jgi:hypothetical protein
MTALFGMKKINADVSDLAPVAESDIGTIKGYFDSAIQNYNTFKTQEKALTDERANYNVLLMKK